MVRLLIIAFVTVFLFTSCDEDFFETSLDIDPPPHTPRLAVHAFVSVEDPVLKVRVSETVSISEQVWSSDLRINDALVVIKNSIGEEIVVPYVSFFDFNYSITLPNDFLIVGQTYTLSVIADGFDEATATQVVPELVPLNSWEFNEDGGINSDGDARSEVEFLFDDPSGVNFYEMGLLFDWNNTSDPNQAYSTFTESLDPSTHRSFEYDFLLLEDTPFDGTNKQISLQLYEISEQDASDHLYFKWESVTEDYYLFSRTLRNFNETDDNPFLSPVQIYSNISSGVGIFSISNGVIYDFN